MQKTQDAKLWDVASLDVHFNPVQCAFAPCGMHVWVHKSILPPGWRTALAFHRAQGKASR